MKNLITFFCFLFLTNNIYALSDKAIAQELRLGFNGDANNLISIILVTRNTPQAQYSHIELDEIALISACLAANINPEKIANIKIKLDETLDKFKFILNEPNISDYLIKGNIKIRKTAILNKFNEYSNYIKNNNNNKKWKIIIFNEAFFSKNTPLTKQEIDTIKSVLFQFIDDEHTILYTNFLYTDNEKVTQKEISSLHNLRKYIT